jgi:tight adherence protein C
MEYIFGILNSVVNDEGISRLAFISLTALTVLVLFLGVGFLFLGLADPVRLRIQSLKKGPSTSITSGGSLMDKQKKSISSSLVPTKGWQNSETRVKLANAGFRSDNALSDYYALRLLSIIVFPALVLFASQFFPELPPKNVTNLMMITAALGFIFPGIVLDKLINARKRALRNAFPDALDMLVVCVEAGLGLQAALLRVADEIQISHPVLAEELHQVNNETRVGVDRIEALRNMAIRTGLEDIRGLIASLDQSIRLGTSIADTLRIYSEEFRDKRLQKAEELAAKIATKMIFPLTFCVWPSFFLVMVGPAILGVLAVWGTR